MFSFGDINLRTVLYYKYLGVIFDEYLSFDKNTAVLAASAGRALGGRHGRGRAGLGGPGGAPAPADGADHAPPPEDMVEGDRAPPPEEGVREEVLAEVGDGLCENTVPLPAISSVLRPV